MCWEESGSFRLEKDHFTCKKSQELRMRDLYTWGALRKWSDSWDFNASLLVLKSSRMASSLTMVSFNQHAKVRAHTHTNTPHTHSERERENSEFCSTVNRATAETLKLSGNWSYESYRLVFSLVLSRLKRNNLRSFALGIWDKETNWMDNYIYFCAAPWGPLHSYCRRMSPWHQKLFCCERLFITGLRNFSPFFGVKCAPSKNSDDNGWEALTPAGTFLLFLPAFNCQFLSHKKMDLWWQMLLKSVRGYLHHQ